MKHIKTLLLVVTIFSFLSCEQPTNSIVGKWEIYKVENLGEIDTEINGRWMEFSADGLLKGGNSSKTTNRTGKWTYDAETKSLWFGSDNDTAGDGRYTINWTDENTIDLTVDETRKVYMKRIEQE